MSEIRTAFLTTVNTTRQAVRASTYTEQTSNGQRSIVSSSIQDAAAGTGARTVRITYQDENLSGVKEEIVALNGTTPVNTVATDICYIEKMDVIETASAGLAAGNILLKAAVAGGGATVAQINALDVRTRYMHHYIGVGRTCNLKMISASCITSDFFIDGLVRKMSLPAGNPFYAFDPVASSLHVDPNSPPSQLWFEDPVQMFGPAKIEFFAKSNAVIGGGTIHADFTFYET